MDQERVREYAQYVQEDKTKLKKFLSRLEQMSKPGQEAVAFDSMLAANPNGREAELENLPTALVKLLTAARIVEGGKEQMVFDGIAIGIEEHKRRHGGEAPSTEAVLAALNQALVFTEHAPKSNPNDRQFDSLSFSHHEALVVVPAAVQVVISMGISNSLPLLSQLPNPTGSNEVPIVYGDAVASIRMGAMNTDDLMDGAKAGLPYLENRHMIAMNQDDSDTAKFTVTSRVGYTKEVRENKTTKFVIDDSTKTAPFLGGRVTVFVKGTEVANDHNRSHPTTTGISTLQPLGEVEINNKTYLVKSATANLDTHEIEVIFDTEKGVAPEADDVDVEVIFDYERKDADGNQILREPGAEVRFLHRSIYAHPSRAKNIATIDSITQLANELNINWYGAALYIIQSKYYFEQTGRLLRRAVNRCLANEETRLVTFDAQKAGIQFTSMSEMFSNISVTLSSARTKLSEAINISIGNYDLYVSNKGAAFFSALRSDQFTPTGLSFGDQSSVYRIGTLNNGANIYYVPASMGVFNEDELTNGAMALMAPRPVSPSKAQFVGHVAVPPMVLAHDISAFEKSVGVYSRQAADLNPLPRYADQCMVIQLINLPNL